ncbi:class I SAM-dependent methyltransferase [Nanoarchaeota archaeon]
MKQDWNEIHKEFKHYSSDMDEILGYRIVHSLLPDLSGKTILDYGCGDGHFAIRMANAGAKVIAVDTSSVAIRHSANNTHNNIEYHTIDEDISFLPPLDAAVANFVFCTIQSDEIATSILKKIRSRLTTEAPFILLDPHPLAPGHNYTTMRKHLTEPMKRGQPVLTELSDMTPFYDYWRSTEDYIELFQQTKYSIDTIEEPMIREDPDNIWLDEKTQPPLIIIKAKKQAK